MNLRHYQTYKSLTTHIYTDDLGYTYKVVETRNGAKWRKTTYKNLAAARRAIRRWAEGSLTHTIKQNG